MREKELFKAPPIIFRQSIGPALAHIFLQKRSVLRSGNDLDWLRMSKQAGTLRKALFLSEHFVAGYHLF
jgi:hypothetical protein